MTNRLALFDCDGTLVDSQANICLSMEEAFLLGGLEAPSRNAIRRIIGLSVVEAVAALSPDLGDTRHRALAEDYKAAFFRLRSTGGMTEEPLFDGMLAALDDLAKAGWLFGVATGKSDRGLARILAHHGIADRFVTLQTADRHPSKPHPSMIEAAIAEAGAEPLRTAMIGDTSYDIVMALNAGVRAVGVSWGYHPADELVAAGAHSVALAVADLPHHLELQ